MKVVGQRLTFAGFRGDQKRRRNTAERIDVRDERAIERPGGSRDAVQHETEGLPGGRRRFGCGRVV
jgi:hypothetical protein